LSNRQICLELSKRYSSFIDYHHKASEGNANIYRLPYFPLNIMMCISCTHSRKRLAYFLLCLDLVTLLNCLVLHFSGQPNFGAIEIDWDAVPTRIKLELRDVEGHSVHGVEFPISQLQPSGAHTIKKQEHAFQRHCTLETELPWLTRHRLALLFFGTIAGMLLASISCQLFQSYESTL
jgi:hypothetical protein